MKVRGFVERSGMVVCGGLPESEMATLTRVVPFSRPERAMLVSWQDPAVWDDEAQPEAAPPARQLPGQGRRAIGDPRPRRAD